MKYVAFLGWIAAMVAVGILLAVTTTAAALPNPITEYKAKGTHAKAQ